jgi:pimeloyl-ACP methyl ester carboxylesterase
MAEAGPANLTLLPGLICDETVWAAQVRDLAEFHPVAVSGYGDADSLPDMAEQVLRTVTGQMSLAGHSMGARVALEVFRLAPGRIARLALLDTGVHPLAPGELGKRQALLDLGRDRGMDALVDAWLPPMVHPDRRDDAEFMDPLVAMCRRAGYETFARQVRALIDRPDARDLLGQIKCPVLVGVGSHDAWSSVHQNRGIAAAIAGAEFVVFEGAGHMAPIEAPAAVSVALRQWLKRPVVE